MTTKKGQGETWSQTTVVLRADILTKAQSAGIDINDLCNRALADATGIGYIPHKPRETAPAAPVIIAHDGAAAGGDDTPPEVLPESVHPVINADDPRSATVVKQVPRPPAQKVPAALPGRVSSPEKTPRALIVPTCVPSPVKPEKPGPGPKKKGKESAIKKFIAECVVRDDTDESHVSKDLLYQAFTHWCREHRITPVPDQKAVTVALKNQFAMTEKSVGGEPSWANLRLL